MTQLEKDYANDSAKARSRDMVRDMISRTLLQFRKPSQLQVLCFPGVDAAEIYQVYDPLGIPRENVTGLERDPKVAHELEKKKLGIRIINHDVVDYIAAQDRIGFDIVSLDYTGPIRSPQIGLLHEIAAKAQKNHMVVHQANLAKRDHLSELLYVVGHVNLVRGEDFVVNTQSSPTGESINWAQSKLALERMENLGKRISEGDDVPERKSDALTHHIGYALSQGGSIYTKKKLKFVYGKAYDQLLRDIELSIKSNQGIEAKLDSEDPVGSLAGYRDQVRSLGMISATKLLEDLIRHSLSKHIELSGVDRELSGFIDAAMENAISDEKSFFLMRNERYSYISGSGAPMIGDVVFASHPERLIASAKEFVGAINFPHYFNIKDKESFYRTALAYSKELQRFNKGRVLDESGISPRQFLGSSAKPVLTRERAIKLMKQGVSLDEIRETHRGWTNKPLAQWKSHVTMRTYDKPQENGDTIRQDAEDSDVEKITQEQALDLLASGIPIKEIIKAYPTSFTKGQLAAFKAHQTMGTYGEGK